MDRHVTIGAILARDACPTGVSAPRDRYFSRMVSRRSERNSEGAWHHSRSVNMQMFWANGVDISATNGGVS